MTDLDLRTLERRVRAGDGDDLDHARLFSALWKRGEADLYVFIKRVAPETDQSVERPVLDIVFDIYVSSRPSDLRVPALVSLRAKGLKFIPGHSRLYAHAAPGIKEHQMEGKIEQMKFHAAWGSSGSIALRADDTEIPITSGQEIRADVRIPRPESGTDVEVSFYPMVRPAEIPR